MKYLDFFEMVKRGELTHDEIISCSENFASPVWDVFALLKEFSQIENRIQEGHMTKEELSNILDIPHKYVVSNAIIQIIKKEWTSEKILFTLRRLSKLKGKEHIYVYGATIGHLATAAIYLLDDTEGRKQFHEVYDGYSTYDKEKTNYSLEGLLDMKKHEREQ